MKTEQEKISIKIGQTKSSEVWVDLANWARSDVIVGQDGKTITLDSSEIPELIIILQRAWRKYCSISSRIN